jgi:hypothetical protein
MTEIISYRDTNLPTVEEIRRRWCFGLPLYDSVGNEMDDEDIQEYVDSAVALMERKLGVRLKPTVIRTDAEARGLVEGVDYEVSEPPYDYDAKAYANWGFLQLRERPASKLTGAKLVLPNGVVVVDFMATPEWVKFYPETAQMQIVPYAGSATVFGMLGGSQTGFSFMTGKINRNMPQMWYIDYVSGYAQNKIPKDIVNIVAKIASSDILGVAGEALKAGITNMSTSIDGLSESVGTTVSSNSTLYGAHIKQFTEDIDKFFDEKETGARSSARGLTFTVL